MHGQYSCVPRPCLDVCLPVQPVLPVPPMQSITMPDRILDFAHCTDGAFDTQGVLYALGTDFGRSPYANPADTGKVRMAWSPDAANYYSKIGGHKQGDAAQAARVICNQTHLGHNATMWSRGAPNAWFSIDLLTVELLPTHFAYRGDYGGGGNHPRTKCDNPAKCNTAVP